MTGAARRCAARLGCAALVGLAGCGSAKGNTTRPNAAGVVSLDASAPRGPGSDRDAKLAPARSHELATLDRKAIGPFVGADGEGGLVVWLVAPDRGVGQNLVVVPLAPDGAPLREARAVARVPQEASSLVVERATGPRRGWIVAWSALLDRGESVSALGIASDGTARGVPGDVQRTSDHIRWVTLVPTPRGALSVWAEETTAGNANVLASSLDPDGKTRGMPVRIASGVAGWQAVAAGGGAALSLVAMGPSDDRPPAGNLTWMRLDADAHPVGGTVVVSRQSTVSSDVDIAPVRDGWLLAWTDRTGEDAQVMLAKVDASGRVQGPQPAMNAVGGASLVALASGPAGVALVWEEPRAAPKRPRRQLHLALVDTGDSGASALPVTGQDKGAALAAQSVTDLDIASNAPVELVSTNDGFALLEPARACLQDVPRRPDVDAAIPICAGPVVPTFLRLGSRLDVVQTEPLLVGTGGRDPAAIGWGLHCRGNDRCSALAALTDAPTPIYAVDLEPRASPYAAPVTLAPAAGAPRVTGIATIASGPFEDLAAAMVGDVTVVAMLTGPSGGDSSRHGQACRITLRAVDADGRPIAPTRILSSHASSVGGVAMAPGAAPEDEAAAAWVTREGGAAALHVARLDRTGHLTREAELARPRAEASDVVLASAEDGWIAAWVDGREGNGEVYAAKVDRDLKHPGRARRVTSGPGDAADIALAVRGDVVWLAWSDPRDNPREGVADVFVTTLHARDASRAGEEVRVMATARHSRSPRIVPTPEGGALVAWIEDAPTGLDGPATAMVARLDASLRVTGTPAALRLGADEQPTAIALTANREGARAVVAQAGRAGVTLDAFRLDVESAAWSAPWHLLDLDAPASFDIALALAGNALLFDDVSGASGGRRIRRATLGWGQ